MAVICPNCKTSNADTVTFCGGCGEFLGGLTAGSVVASRYEIVRLLGRGGMGLVYEAHDRTLDEPVALKILRPDPTGSGDLARRFVSEIKLARKVRHPNVCGIHDYGEDGRLQFISMELVEGSDLKDLVRQQGAFSPGEARETALQVAEGLQAVHAKGIVHRDLKTSNIMRDSSGAVRLMDFGIARRVSSEGTDMTATGQVVGTPEYMSPEQARGSRVDLRSDIYSLGIVVYEICTGQVPFLGETPVATILKHLHEAPPLDSPAARDLPDSLRAILGRALAKDPDERYADMGEMIQALRKVQATLPSATPATVSPTTPAAPTPTQQTPPSTRVTPTPIPPPSAVPMPPGSRGTSSRTSPRTTPRTPRLPKFLLIAGIAGVASLLLGSALLVSYALQARRARSDVGAPPATTTRPSPPRPVTPTTTAPTPEDDGAGADLAGPPEPTPAQTPVATPEPKATARPTPRPTATPRPTPIRVPLGPPPASPSTPTPTPVPETGRLLVIVKPWASVEVDGETMGSTPLASPLELSPGPHEVRLVHPDYYPFNRNVTIESGKMSRMEVDLTWEGFKRE